MDKKPTLRSELHRMILGSQSGAVIKPKAHAWTVGSHDQATVDSLRKEYATTYGPNVVPLVRVRRAA